MIKYPDILPKPSTESYQIEVSSGTVRTEFASGEAKHRRIRRNPPDIFSIIWDMTPAEFSIFEKFFDHEAKGGAEWFEMEQYTGEGYKTGVFRFSDPTRPYIVTNIGPRDFKVSALLERRDRFLISDEEYAVRVLGFTDEQFVDFSERLHADVNTHLPLALSHTADSTPINFGGNT